MRGFVVAITLCLIGFAEVARADPSDEEVEQRLTFIEKRLEAATPEANAWSYGWLATFGGLSLAQFGIALGTKDPGFRADMAVGSLSCALGVLPFAIMPFTPRYAAGALATWPARTPDERRKKLARAEALLEKSAKVERAGHGPTPHILGLGVAFGAGLVLDFAYKRIRTGMMNTAVGVVLVEAQIFTQPTTAIDDWDDEATSRASSHQPRFAIGGRRRLRRRVLRRAAQPSLTARSCFTSSGTTWNRSATRP